MNAAQTVWQTTNLWSTKGRALVQDNNALMEVDRISAQVLAVNLIGGRIPRDIYAPSAGHAACVLVSQNIAGRVQAHDGDRRQFWDVHGGFRPIYRGQSVPWHIAPRAWREPVDSMRAIAAMAAYLGTFVEPKGVVDPSLDLLGQLQEKHHFLGLGQHYELPTTLVDFTFDPFVALNFANGHCPGDHTTLDVRPRHAVVYLASLFKTSVTAKPSWHFPPIVARRLYVQSGMFVDYGAVPADYDQPFTEHSSWAGLENECTRLLFPRSYPDADLLGLAPFGALMTDDPFFIRLIVVAMEFAKSNRPIDDGLCGYVGKRMQGVPTPWKCARAGQIVSSAKEYIAVGRLLDKYLRCATLVQTNDGLALDPLLIAHLTNFHHHALIAIRRLYELTGNEKGEFSWLNAQLNEAIQSILQAHERVSAP